jgi:hypothetical protein
MIARIVFAVVLAGALSVPALAEPCNPVIDGTYCATQTIRRENAATSSGGIRLSPMQGIARDIGPWTDQPATLGGITFRGSETCMGLFRRGSCN